MKIFVSYASEQHQLAERIAIGLRADGHTVFFDAHELTPSAGFNRRIREGLRRSDLLVFLLTPDSVRGGAFALSELKMAREQWPDPAGRVLPVEAAVVPHAEIPGYLASVSILKPAGDVVAETLSAVASMARRHQARRWKQALAATAMAALMAGGFIILPPFQDPLDVAAVDSMIPEVSPRHAQTTRLSGRNGTRGRAVVAASNGAIVAALADPAAVAFIDGSFGVVEEIAMPGEVSALAVGGGIVVAGILYPPSLTIIDADSRNTLVVQGIPSDRRTTSGEVISSEPESIAVAENGDVWVRTSGTQGEAGLFVVQRSDLGRGTWTVPSYADRSPPDDDTILRSIGHSIWTVDTATTPSSLGQLTITDFVEYSGHDYDSISCARDVAGTHDGDLLLMSCDGKLLQLRVESDRLQIVHRWATSLEGSGPNGTWEDQTIAPTGDSVIVANSIYAVGSDQAIATRVAAIDTSGRETLLLESDNGRVASLAVSGDLLVAVLRSNDGTRSLERLDAWPTAERRNDR